ncbi:MAG: hypothetical protein ABIC95_03480 [archaeon]
MVRFFNKDKPTPQEQMFRGPLWTSHFWNAIIKKRKHKLWKGRKMTTFTAPLRNWGRTKRGRLWTHARESTPVTSQMINKSRIIDFLSARIEQLRGLEGTGKKIRYPAVEEVIKPRIMNMVSELGVWTTHDVANHEKVLMTKGTGEEYHTFNLELPMSVNELASNPLYKLTVPITLPIPKARTIRYADGHITDRVRYFGEKRDTWWRDHYVAPFKELGTFASHIYNEIRKEIVAGRTSGHIDIGYSYGGRTNWGIDFSFTDGNQLETLSGNVSVFFSVLVQNTYTSFFHHLINTIEVGVRSRVNHIEKFLAPNNEFQKLWDTLIAQAPKENETRFVHSYQTLRPVVFDPEGFLTGYIKWRGHGPPSYVDLSQARPGQTPVVIELGRYGDETGPGLDENGMPLEVNPDTGGILVDRWRREWWDKLPIGQRGSTFQHEPPLIQRKIDSHRDMFVVKWDIISTANMINAEWDEIRDCIRDGRYYDVPTIYDHVSWTQKCHDKEWKVPAYERPHLMDGTRIKKKSRTFNIARYFPGPGGQVARYPDDPRGETVYQSVKRKPTHLTPSFDMTAMTTKDEDFRYPGKLFYYDANNLDVKGAHPDEPSSGNHPDNPKVFSSSRGVSMFLYDMVLFKEFYLDNVKKTFNNIGKLDLGPRKFSWDFNQGVLDWGNASEGKIKKLNDALFKTYTEFNDGTYIDEFDETAEKYVETFDNLKKAKLPHFNFN